MLSKKMEAAINDQMNFEIYSGYIYLAMGAYLDESSVGRRVLPCKKDV